MRLKPFAQPIADRLGRAPAGIVLAAALIPAALVLVALIVDGRSAATTVPREAATYVGAETCASCHRAESDQWQKSHHALAMQHADETTVLGDFDDATFEKDGVAAPSATAGISNRPNRCANF
jgi:cytochrome c553